MSKMFMNVKEDLLQEKRQWTGNYSLSCRKSKSGYDNGKFLCFV